MPSTPPNIAWIMADDLDNDWKDDRLTYMPHLSGRLRDEGALFEHHVAAQPVCGPSRSSLLLGRWPHNTGYVANGDLDSIAAFVSQHNKSVGKWLSDAGYYTAFHGKYVNSCEAHVPSGWSHWGGFIQTYNFYNASCWAVEAGVDVPPESTVKVMTGIHQADFLGNFTLESAARALALGKPFFIHTTPVMPHWGTCDGPKFPPGEGYAPDDPHWEFDLTDATGKRWAMPISPCPTKRHAHSFDGQRNTHVPGLWNVSITGARPLHMRQTVELPGRLTDFQVEREDMGWRNRSCALRDLDDLLGVIINGFESLGVLQDTFVLFTSDNGYHLGEHKLPFGKGLPYETDTRLPFYIRGPNVFRNVTLPHPTTHLDITATVVDIARAQAFVPTQLDGKSFLGEILGEMTYEPTNKADAMVGTHTTSALRALARVEGAPPRTHEGEGVEAGGLKKEGVGAVDFAARADAWRQFSFSEFFGGDITWRLVRVHNSSHSFTYADWCTNDTEVFDLTIDPHQTRNLAGGGGAFAARVVDAYAPLAVSLGRCNGAACSSPIPASAPSFEPCLTVYPQNKEYAGAWNLLPGSERKPIKGLHGWAVDYRLKGGPSGVRGWPAVRVRVLLDGKRSSALPDQLANISRPDVVHGLVPNAEHGFEYRFPPDFLGAGKHSLEVFALDDGGHKHPLSSASASKPQCVCGGVACKC